MNIGRSSLGHLLGTLKLSELKTDGAAILFWYNVVLNYGLSETVDKASAQYHVTLFMEQSLKDILASFIEHIEKLCAKTIDVHKVIQYLYTQRAGSADGILKNTYSMIPLRTTSVDHQKHGGAMGVERIKTFYDIEGSVFSDEIALNPREHYHILQGPLLLFKVEPHAPHCTLFWLDNVHIAHEIKSKGYTDFFIEHIETVKEILFLLEEVYLTGFSDRLAIKLGLGPARSSLLCRYQISVPVNNFYV
ncbi:hypothetical protein ACTFIU_011195 [Dictyostelium citrinum]